MEFTIRRLSVLSYANGFTFFHYNGKLDTVSNCFAHNYFADACNVVSPGDMILISTATGGAMAFVSATAIDSVVLSRMASTS